MVPRRPAPEGPRERRTTPCRAPPYGGGEGIPALQLDKNQIIEFLKERGEHGKAQQADQQLPDKVDTDQHGGLLAQHGVSVEELIGKFGGEPGKLA